MANNSDQIKAGAARAPQRSLLRAMGMDNEAIRRPFIGVANSFTETVPGHIHLREVGQAVKDAVRAAGGTPMEFHTIGVCDGLAMGHAGMYHSLPSRELVADSVEFMARAHGFDALVLIASCDKIVPGMLMAAARLDLPAVMLTGGPMMPGHYKGELVDLISVFEAVGKVAAGQMSEAELAELEECACPGAGSCAGMFTANTMACVTEALGMSMPGCATAHAVSERKLELARQSGAQVMELLKRDIRPSAIITQKSLENALRVDLALGGSTNTALHLPAIAWAAGLKLDLATIDRLSRETPHLASMSPGGPMRMEQLDQAGGVGAVMYQLREKMNLDCPTVNGGPLSEYLPAQAPQAEAFGQRIIHGLDDAVHDQGGLAVLSGSLAPDGAVVKQTAMEAGKEVHQGPARVFEREEEAVAAYQAGEIKPGEVLVIRYEGPAGGPGMREMLALTAMISGGPLNGQVAMVTDGRFSGGSRGAVIGHVSPEAASGGPIALVRDGDQILVDVPGRRLEVLVDAEELKRRRAAWQPPAPRFTSGPLARYASMVTSAAQGAVLEIAPKGKE